MDVLLAPDVFVNASVAFGSSPEQVVRRVLGRQKTKQRTNEWVLARIRHMLSSVPEFKIAAVQEQLGLIRSMLEVMPTDQSFAPGEWEQALVAAAKQAGVSRVVTDHPDLLENEDCGGIEFVSTDAYLLELMTPPPPPLAR